jgi:bacteriocin-like protein
METLTKKEMFEIEGGDWWGGAEGIAGAFLMCLLCL